MMFTPLSNGFCWSPQGAEHMTGSMWWWCQRWTRRRASSGTSSCCSPPQGQRPEHSSKAVRKLWSIMCVRKNPVRLWWTFSFFWRLQGAASPSYKDTHVQLKDMLNCRLLLPWAWTPLFSHLSTYKSPDWTLRGPTCGLKQGKRRN